MSARTSANTGVAPTCSTAVAVATKVSEGTMTSSPGPMPEARSIAASATVPLAIATACSVPCRSAMAASKRRVQGPLVSTPEPRTSVTAATSSGPVTGAARRMRGSGGRSGVRPTDPSGS